MENPIKMDDLGVPLFSETPIYWLVVEPTHLKNMPVKMGSSSPKFRGENKKYLKPPPRIPAWSYLLIIQLEWSNFEWYPN